MKHIIIYISTVRRGVKNEAGNWVSVKPTGLIFYGNSKYVAQAWRKRYFLICDCSRSSQMPKRDQLTVILILTSTMVEPVGAHD